MPDSRVPTAPCSKCGRPVAATAKRCIYCGTVQYKAAPGTPERAAEEAAALEEDKKLKQQAALYRAGMGAGMKGGEPKGFAEKAAGYSLPGKVLVAALLVPLLLVWPPIPIKIYKVMFTS